MSTKERDRLQVLHEVKKRHITQKQGAVELYRQKKQAKLWHDYGPALAAEELAEDYGIAISRETLLRKSFRSCPHATLHDTNASLTKYFLMQS